MLCKFFEKSFFILLLLSFFSCSNTQIVDVASFSNETLKEISEKKDDELLWTRELESVRLTRDYSKNQATTTNFKLSPESISIANTRNQVIYPFLQDFGSLDTSSISSDLEVYLDDLCSLISQWNLESIKCDENSIFSLALFKNDVEHLWKKEFVEEFPIFDKESLTEDNKIIIFNEWIFGQPFFSEDSIQVPIRFYCKNGSVDVKIYIKNDLNYLVEQIELQKMKSL